jgi:hypothetical protein
MLRPNPYQSSDGDNVPSSSPSGRQASGSRPQASAIIVRGLEYVIALLIVLALIWVVHVFVLTGDWLR